MFGLVQTMISVDRLRREAVEQFADAELIATDAVDRIEVALQHVVATVVALRLLDRDHVLGFFDHAQHAVLASRVTAEAALDALRINRSPDRQFGDVEASTAERDPPLHLVDARPRGGRASSVGRRSR